MLLIALALMSPPPPADPTGLWRTPRGAQIRIERCGQALCGSIATLEPGRPGPEPRDTRNSDVSKRGRPIKGMTMLTGFTGGPARWSGGKVYNPEDGKTYSGSLDLVNPQTLKLKGCAFAFFCRTQQWKRVG